ncbi:MAG: hypothetical protein AAF602_28165, partial [Myxococcota bacterium]
MPRPSLLAGALLLLPACGLPLGNEPIPTSNRCVDDEDCGADGICLVDQALCVSRTADLDELTVEIFVPSGAAEEAGTSSLITLPALRSEDANGLVVQRDLTLPFIHDVVGKLEVEDEKCDPLVSADGNFPITLELRPSATLTGLSLQSFGDASSPLVGQVSFPVPAGLYDITLRPETSDANPDEAANACILPPALFKNVRVDSDFTIDLGVNSPVEHVNDVRGFDVEGWQVDLIDGERGRPISNVVTLDSPASEPPGSELITGYRLRYWQEVVDQGGGAFLRLRPPADRLAEGYPTVLNALSLETPFNLEKLSEGTQIDVQANVVDGNDGLSARVIIQSVRFLDGEMGNSVFYKYETQTDDAGVLDVKLYTGTYSFTAIPDNPLFAPTETLVELGENDLGGKTLVLQPNTPVRGTLTTASGTPAFGLGVNIATVNSTPPSFVSSRL